MALFKKNKNEAIPEMDDSQLEAFTEEEAGYETMNSFEGEEAPAEEIIDFYQDSADADEVWSADEIASAKTEEFQSKAPVWTLIAGFAAFILAFLLFLWMFISWRSTASKQEVALRNQNATTTVVTTKVAFDEYEELTIPKILASVQYTKVYKDSVPEGAIHSWEELIGYTTKHKIPQGAILTKTDVENFQTAIEPGMMVITIPLGDLVYKNGGDIRAGDSVVLAQIIEGRYEEFYELTVYQLIDASGVPQETALTSSMLKMIVPAGDISDLYETISTGTVIMTKVLK